jgi:hypothetical protein
MSILQSLVEKAHKIECAKEKGKKDKQLSTKQKTKN